MPETFTIYIKQGKNTYTEQCAKDMPKTHSQYILNKEKIHILTLTVEVNSVPDCLTEDSLGPRDTFTRGGAIPQTRGFHFTLFLGHRVCSFFFSYLFVF
jgi:hypothetical protein